MLVKFHKDILSESFGSYVEPFLLWFADMLIVLPGREEDIKAGAVVVLVT